MTSLKPSAPRIRAVMLWIYFIVGIKRVIFEAQRKRRNEDAMRQRFSITKYLFE